MENTTTMIDTEAATMIHTDTVADASATADEGKIRIPGFKVLGLKKICGTNDYQVKLLFENKKVGLKENVSLSMTEVKSPAKFRKKIPPAFTTPYKPSQIIEHLQYAIYQELNHPGFTVGYALPQGFSFVENELFYVMGDSIFPTVACEKDRSVSSNQFVAENPEDTKFFLPTSRVRKIKFERALDWVRAYCAQGAAQTVLFLCAMTPYMKYILPDVFDKESVVPAYVVGQSGFGKTEQIKLLRTTEVMYGLNLESDMKEILIGLASFPDRAVQIDDLNKTASDSIRAKKESKVSSLLQMGSSAAGAIRSKDVNVDLGNTALLFSAEYVLPNYSTINRTVLLYIRRAFDPKILTWLQQNRALYGCFLIRFISMICCHCEKLQEILTEYHDNEPFQIPNVEAAESYVGFERVFRHYKILRLTAYAIGCCISDPEKRDELSCMFKEATNICARDTLEAVRKVKESDVVVAFLEIFEHKQIAKSVEKYFEQKEKNFSSFTKIICISRVITWRDICPGSCRDRLLLKQYLRS